MAKSTNCMACKTHSHRLPQLISFCFPHSSAIIPGDYIAVDTLLTLSPSQTTISINVPIIDDNLDEPDELLGADLELQTDNDGVTIAPGTASVEIVDNDGEGWGVGVASMHDLGMTSVRVWHQ